MRIKGQRWYQERYKKGVQDELVNKDFLGLGVTSRLVETGPISTTRLSEVEAKAVYCIGKASAQLPGSFPPPTRVATHGKQVAST